MSDVAIIEIESDDPAVIEVGVEGPPGRLDDADRALLQQALAAVGGAAAISADQGNTLEQRQDGLFVPEAIPANGGVDLVVLFENRIA